MPLAQMTSHERTRAALLGEERDRLPFSPFLAYVWESYPEEVRSAGMRAFLRRIGADPMWRGAPCPVKQVPPPELEVERVEEGDDLVVLFTNPAGTLRQRIRRSAEGNTAFLIEHPIRTAEDCRIALWTEERTELVYDPGPMEEHFAGAGAEGLSVGMLVPRGKSAYQILVEHLMGTEELVYALMDFPDEVETLWRTMVEKDLQAVRLAVQGEYEFWLSYEDSSTQNYSPAQYEQYIALEIRQWCDLLEDAGKHYIQHACGHLKGILQPMKASGAYGVESISPPPTGDIEIAEARELTGPDFAIIGGIEPTKLLQLPDAELDAYVERVIAEAQPGRFVLANSDSCPPGVTPERFARIAEIAHAHP